MQVGQPERVFSIAKKQECYERLCFRVPLTGTHSTVGAIVFAFNPHRNAVAAAGSRTRTLMLSS